MRIDLGSKGVGGRNESWYYLEINEATGEKFLIHEWNNLPFSGPIDKGETKTPLSEAAGLPYYGEALNAAK